MWVLALIFMSEKCAQKNKLTNGFMHFLTHKQSVWQKLMFLSITIIKKVTAISFYSFFCRLLSEFKVKNFCIIRVLYLLHFLHVRLYCAFSCYLFWILRINLKLKNCLICTNICITVFFIDIVRLQNFIIICVCSYIY